MNPTLPTALYTVTQARELDRAAIEDFGIPGGTLMERAGQAVFEALRARWPQAGHVAVVCGVGNNAGDGFVVGRLLRETGLRASVLYLGDPERLKGYALGAAQRLQAIGGVLEPFDPERVRAADVVVDAIFGTGLERPVEGHWREAVAAINAARAPVVAVDVPSGLAAETGAVLGAAVRATLTVTFIGLKQGLFTGEAPEVVGEVQFSDLGVPGAVYQRVAPAAERIGAEAVAACLPPRRRGAHKGELGHVLIVGGDHGMPGAVRLAGEAAARAGAGWVSVATRPAHVAALAGARPELMVHGVEAARDLQPLLERATVVAVGPGLGQSTWSQLLLARVLEARRPLVVDADALNLIAREPATREDWILTPHPGEAARLLGVTPAEVQSDRYAAAAAIVQRYGGACVLKGAGTVVRDPDGGVGVCDRGNPGMASGGMGDVLTGVVAGLLAQGLGLGAAARTGVYVHGAAGDHAAAAGERGLLAGDLLGALRAIVNPVPP